MIVRIVKLSVEPIKISNFIKEFEKVKDKIKAVEGCRHLELLINTNQDGVVFTHSLWDSIAALENYISSPLFKSIWVEVKPMLIAKTEAWSLMSAKT